MERREGLLKLWWRRWAELAATVVFENLFNSVLSYVMYETTVTTVAFGDVMPMLEHTTWRMCCALGIETMFDMVSTDDKIV